MKVGNILIASSTAIILSAGVALAGPCNTSNKDAGSGPTPGHTAQTTGAASRNDEHPPTSTMNNAADDVATHPKMRSGRCSASLPPPKRRKVKSLKPQTMVARLLPIAWREGPVHRWALYAHFCC
jgi:hypothetical protein